MAVYEGRTPKGFALDDVGYRIRLTEEDTWLRCTLEQFTLVQWIRDRATVHIETDDEIVADPNADPPVVGVPETVKAMWMNEEG